MNITTEQLVDIDIDLSIQEIYDQMDDDDIEEMIELLREDGHITPNKDEYEKTYTDIEWETMLTSLITRNATLLITKEEYEQVKAIYQRIGI